MEGGEGHEKDLEGGKDVSKKTTRIIALVIVAVMVLSFLGSMILPYI